MGSVGLLLCGASGAGAYFLGLERLLNKSYGVANGLACETVQTVKIRKNGAIWIRKYIRTSGGQGEDRLKTALRVAQAVYARQKPDLVQISVLDENGPTLRSNMRGRAISAQAVYIHDPSKFPLEGPGQAYSGFYYEGEPSPDGQFYGLKIDVSFEDIEKLVQAQNVFTECHGEAEEPLSNQNVPNENPVPASASEELKPVVEPPKLPDEPTDGEIEDLFTSTPEHQRTSYFSLAYLNSVFFGKATQSARIE